jgi:ATP-dependent helicase/DNAse subunit B
LGIKDKETEIATVDARELGSLYHRILERLFKRIAQESPRFRVEELSKYKRMLGEECSNALEERSQIEGAFQESVYAMLETKIISALEAFLDQAILKLDAAALVGAELPLRLEYPEYGLALSGKADLVVQGNNGSFALYDFKTGVVPGSADLAPDDDGNLGNYQIASYIRMIENGTAEKVRNAAFYSIEDRRFTQVLSTEVQRRSNQRLPLEREEYEVGLDALDDVFQAAAGMLAEASFPIPPFGFRQACATCTVASVCRLPFSGGEPEAARA